MKILIGFYDYTMLLTYLSLLSAVTGIILSTSGMGHPYLGCFFLLLCGLCDTFDGIVARSKPDRTETQKAFGMQIDSLSDLVAFGVLPGTIAVGLYTSGGRHFAPLTTEGRFSYPVVLFVAGVLFYILAAMIRLAYFNVLELENRGRDENGRKQYTGLPVTAAALIFPFLLLFNFVTLRDFSILYFLGMPVVGLLFLGRFHIRKPDRRTLILLLAAGAIEFVLLLVLWLQMLRRG